MSILQNYPNENFYDVNPSTDKNNHNDCDPYPIQEEPTTTNIKPSQVNPWISSKASKAALLSKKAKPLKRVKSRISNALEHTAHNEIFDLDDEDRKNTSVNSAEENIDSCANVLINVSILLQKTPLNKNTNNTSNNNNNTESIKPVAKTISFIVTKKMTIATIKEKAINNFNETFMKEKTNLRLVDDSDYYVLKPAKKNGHPKSDMPIYADSAQIGEMGSTNYALCWKETPDDFSYMFEVMRKKNVCQNNCVIM